MQHTGIVDIGGYVAPGMELVYESGPGEFRSQWERLQEHLSTTAPDPLLGDRASYHLTLTVGGRRPPSGVWDAGKGERAAGAPLEVGVLHDNAAGRLRAMDAAGIDVQLLSPGATLAGARWLPENLGAGVLGAFNRYSRAYAAADPRRLRPVVQLHGGEPEWSAAELRELVATGDVAAATIWLPAKFSPDDRRFVPIWNVLAEFDVPLLHRAGACAGVWSGRRMLAFLAHTGMLERYPTLRVTFADAGLEWTDDWIDRVESAVAAAGHPAVDLRGDARDGRIFAAVGPDDDGDAVDRAIAQLGDGALLWESRFPYRRSPVTAPPPGGVDVGRNARTFIDGKQAVGAGVA